MMLENIFSINMKVYKIDNIFSIYKHYEFEMNVRSENLAYSGILELIVMGNSNYFVETTNVISKANTPYSHIICSGDCVLAPTKTHLWTPISKFRKGKIGYDASNMVMFLDESSAKMFTSQLNLPDHSYAILKISNDLLDVKT